MSAHYFELRRQSSLEGLGSQSARLFFTERCRRGELRRIGLRLATALGHPIAAAVLPASRRHRLRFGAPFVNRELYVETRGLLRELPKDVSLRLVLGCLNWFWSTITVPEPIRSFINALDLYLRRHDENARIELNELCEDPRLSPELVDRGTSWAVRAWRDENTERSAAHCLSQFNQVLAWPYNRRHAAALRRALIVAWRPWLRKIEDELLSLDASSGLASR